MYVHAYMYIYIYIYTHTWYAVYHISDGISVLVLVLVYGTPCSYQTAKHMVRELHVVHG